MKKIWLSTSFWLLIISTVNANEMEANTTITENNNAIIVYGYQKPKQLIQREIMTYYERDKNNIEVETGKVAIDYDRNGLVERRDDESYAFDGTVLGVDKLRRIDEGWVQGSRYFEYGSERENFTLYHTDKFGRITDKTETKFFEAYLDMESSQEITIERYQYDDNHQLQGYIRQYSDSPANKVTYVYANGKLIAENMEYDGKSYPKLLQYKFIYDKEQRLTLYTIVQNYEGKKSERYFRYTKFNQIGDWIESERSNSSRSGYLLRIEREIHYYD